MRPRQFLKARHAAGQGLIGALAALAVLGVGSAALIRWTVDLELSARAQSQRAMALGRLAERAELGPIGQALINREGGATSTAGGLSVREAMHHQPDGGDPQTGQHHQVEVEWTDPWGRSQRLQVRLYWAAGPRIY